VKPRIIIRPTADAELEEQAAYIAQDSLDAALRFLRAAEATFGKLAETPEIGRLWASGDERLAGVRVWHVKGFENWLIFYRPSGDGIEVLHVFHGARDLPPLLEQDEE
jgi:toxin ParE1/3/4